MKHALLSALMLIGCQANAAVQIVPRWALEKNAAETSAGAADRLYAMEAIVSLGDAMKLKAEGGGWITRQSDRKSAWFVSASWGYRAVLPLGGLFVEAFVGPA